MSSLKRRLLFGLFSLALLSICLWYGYEFLNLARIKQSEKAAGAFCAKVKNDMSLEQVIALTNAGNSKPRLAISSDELHVQFGQRCECRVHIHEGKATDKTVTCQRP